MATEQTAMPADRAVMTKLIELCPDAIIGIDRSGTVSFFNQKAALLIGRPAVEVIGHLHIREVYGSLDKARDIKIALYADAHGGPDRIEGFETTIVTAGGDTIPIRLSATLLKGSDGEEIGSVGFFHDLTTRKELEGKLRTLSITDGLTGLYNQRFFYQSLSDEMVRAQRYDRPLSLICFDLDRFKACNDRFGHLEGDNILRQVGDLLRKRTRRSDMAFRYGGDEFFVLLPETALQQACNTAEKIRESFNRSWLHEAAEKDVQDLRVSLSIGVVERRDEVVPENLIKRADLAMYSAKKSGGDCVKTEG
jgi:diguanylate cyclase (GGDEF)-like protein/PAS domain S-box-containing protein